MITATLATIPGREGEAGAAVESLLPQVDALYCVFNYGEKPWPEWARILVLQTPKFYPISADNSLGDGAKFTMSERADGYQLICDDDLIYPPNYAESMVGQIKKYQRRAAIGLGGSVISGPVESYYNGRRKHGHALRKWRNDTFCNVLVTCALGFHSDAIRFPIAEIRHRNMADIFFALHCQRNRIPMVCSAHEADFLRYPDTMRGKWTICGCRSEHDHIQAGYLNEWKEWRVWTP